MSEVNDDLMLLYVAGVCDADETDRAEALLSAANPVAAAMLAEAVSVFHAVPFGLSPVEPPSHCRHLLLGRVTADISSTAHSSSMSIGLASKLRWPLYVSSGLAACLAVALTMSMWNGRQMARQLADMSERDQRMQSTLTNTREVMASPRVTLASLNTQESISPVASPAVSQIPRPFGRVLFCPITRRYQFAFFNLPPLPEDRRYEMWLLADGRDPHPTAQFAVGADSTAWVITQLNRDAPNFKRLKITDEPIDRPLTQPTGQTVVEGDLPNR